MYVLNFLCLYQEMEEEDAPVTMPIMDDEEDRHKIVSNWCPCYRNSLNKNFLFSFKSAQAVYTGVILIVCVFDCKEIFASMVSYHIMVWT